MKHITLYAHRVLLTPLDTKDDDLIFSLTNSEKWLKFIGQRNIKSRKDAVVYINQMLHTTNTYVWVIRIKQNHQPIGIITFLKRASLSHFDLGFALLPRYEQKGYATEAAQATLQHISKLQLFDTISALCLPNNEASIKILNKLLFEFKEMVEQGDETLMLWQRQIG